MSGSQALVITAVCTLLTVGLLLPLPAVLRLSLAARLGRDEAHAAGLRWVYLLTLVPAFLVSGLVINELHLQEALVLGSLATGVGLASLGRSWGYRPALGATALTALALAFLYTAGVALLPAAFVVPGPRPRPATSTNLGYLFLGLSSLLIPALGRLLERKLGVRQALLVLALVSLVPAVAAGLAPADDFPATPPAGTLEILADSRLWLAGLVLLLYLPLEALVTARAPAYLAEVGRSPQGLPLALLGFWIALLCARFLTALAPAGFVPWLVLLLLVLAAATLGNLSGIFHSTGGTLGVWLLGACLGPVLPSVLGLVFQGFPEHPALAFGVVMAVASCGSVAVQPLLERFADRHAVRVSMRLVMLGVLMVAVPALVLCLVL